MGHLRVASMTAGHRRMPQPVASGGDREHHEQHGRYHPHRFCEGPQTGHVDGKCRSCRGDDSGSHDGGEPIGSQASADLRYHPVVVRAYSCHELKTLPPRVGISGRSRILVLQVDDLKQFGPTPSQPGKGPAARHSRPFRRVRTYFEKVVTGLTLEGTMPSAEKLLRLALVVFGVVALLLYPLALVWPSGWAWHSGAPYESEYFMMIVGLYATLRVSLINAARNPAPNLSLIWFAVWSSVVHAAIMAVQSFSDGHMGHLWGDVTALLLMAVVLSVLVLSSGLKQSAVAPSSAR